MPIPAGTGVPTGVTTGLYLTLTYDTVLGRVRITASGIPAAATTVTIERSINQTRWEPVRGGLSLTPLAGAVKLDDYEFAADVANYYRVRAYTAAGREVGPTLNADPYVEVDLSGWTAFNGATAVRSTTRAHQGAASVLITPDGVTSSGGVIDAAPRAAVVAGEDYLTGVWVWPTQAMTLGSGAEWWTATTGGTFLSGISLDVSVSAGTWTYLSSEFTAPTLTVGGAVRVRHNGTPPAASTYWADEIQINQLDSGPILAGYVTPALGGVWLKSLARPFLNRQVTVRDFSEVSRPSRAGVFDVVGRSFPVAVNDVRGSRRWTLDLNTGTPQEAVDLDLLFASGDTLLIQVPAAAGRVSATPGGYVTVGDVRETTPPTYDLRSRIFSLPCTEVAAPGPDVVGATSNWQTVLNTYATWADLIAAKATWADVLELVGDPTDVVVL